MAKQIKKSAVSKADTKELRALAATAGIKFIGKKTEDLRSELLKVAVDDKAKPVKKAKKEGEAKPAGKKEKKAAKKDPAPKKERVAVSAKDTADIEKLDTKKARVITLRERGYSIHSIAEAVDLHPTNVSRYIREAGLSTSTATVPQERKDRIKATIAAKKPAAAPAPKAAPVAKQKEPAKKTVVAAKPGKTGKASKKAEKKPASKK
jgi:hypothetical protein